MTASTAPTGTVVVPAPRAALPPVPVPAPRTPVDEADCGTAPVACGRHRAAATARTRRDRIARTVTLAARTGSVVTLGAMLVVAAAAAGLSDGQAPTGDAAAVATATLR